MELEGTVAVVTGAASGIGRASALAFAASGAGVVVSDVDESGAKAVVSEIEEAGGDAIAIAADVADREAVEGLVAGSIDWRGHCDLFFSNAGVAVSGPAHRIPIEDWEWIVDINMWAHVWAVRAVLPHMLERGRGHLVHTASAAGLLGVPNLAPYNMTKFAVVGLAESLAVYLADKGIGVSVLCPMFVSTNIMRGARATPEDGTDEEAFKQGQAMAEAMIRSGLAPETVGEQVVDAVRAGRLYVLPHPEVKAIVEAKWSDPEAWVQNVSQVWRAQREMFI